jgi:hypothetical protein
MTYGTILSENERTETDRYKVVTIRPGMKLPVEH